MNILIFGATGFIGKNLSHSLIRKNHNITVVSRNQLKVEQLFQKKVDRFELNYDNTEELSKVISKHETVINLAGENIASRLWTKKQKHNILHSRLKVGSYITEAIIKAERKPQLLIQASAIGYYGYQTYKPHNEESPKGEGFLAEITEKWEKSTEHVESLGVKRIVIRTGVVLGNDSGLLPKLITPVKFYAGSNFGKGMNYISWIHIDDEIRAIDHLIHNKNSKGVYNLVAPNPRPSSELNKIIAHKLKRPVWFNIPSGLIRFFLGAMGKELLLAHQEVYPKKLQDENFTFKYENLDHALNSLL